MLAKERWNGTIARRRKAEYHGQLIAQDPVDLGNKSTFKRVNANTHLDGKAVTFFIIQNECILSSPR